MNNMKNNTLLKLLLSLLIIAITTISCKKQNAEPKSVTLENTTWLLSQEFAYFPNDKLEIYTRNSVWTFLGDQKLKIFNPLSYIQEWRGEWNRTLDNKLIIMTDLRNTKSYEIITETPSLMRIEDNEPNFESSNGKAYKINYILVLC